MCLCLSLNRIELRSISMFGFFMAHIFFLCWNATAGCMWRVCVCVRLYLLNRETLENKQERKCVIRQRNESENQNINPENRFYQVDAEFMKIEQWTEFNICIDRWMSRLIKITVVSLWKWTFNCSFEKRTTSMLWDFQRVKQKYSRSRTKYKMKQIHPSSQPIRFYPISNGMGISIRIGIFNVPKFHSKLTWFLGRKRLCEIDFYYVAARLLFSFSSFLSFLFLFPRK